MSLKPIVIARDPRRTPESGYKLSSGKKPVWYVYVRNEEGTLCNLYTTVEGKLRVALPGEPIGPQAFTKKSDAENAAQIYGRYVLKLGDMVAFHILWRDAY